MAKSKWVKTPFKNLEQARTVAERFGLYPSAIITAAKARASDATLRSFTTSEGRKVMLIAQQINSDGVPVGPVLEKVLKRGSLTSTRGSAVSVQDPNAPRFSEDDRLQVGPWCRSDHKNFEEVEAYHRAQCVNFDNVEVLKLVLYRIGGDEYEYGLDRSGVVWVRVLHATKGLRKKEAK